MMSPLARRLPDLVAWLGVALLAAFTLIERGPSHAQQWPWFLYAQLLVLTPLLRLIAQGCVSGRLHRLGGALDWALLGFAGAMTAAALLSSYQHASLSLLPTVLVPVSTAYAVAQWFGAETAGGRRRRQLEQGGALFLTVASGVSLVGWTISVILPQLSAGAPFSALFSGRNEWLLGHSVYTAGLGLLTTTWLAGLARERRGRARLLCVAGAAVGLVNLFSSGSRSGFIGFGLWFVWLFVAEVQCRRWPLRRALLTGAVFAATAVGLALLHPRTRVIIAEWRSSGTINTGDRQRFAMAEFGALVLHEHPFLGIGPGATPLVYPAYRARLSGGVEAALQLHSTPFQWAADAGIPALAAAALAALAIWRRRRSAPSTFASGALLAYAGLALTDYQLDVPVFAFAVGVLVALCALSALPQQSQSSPPKPSSPPALPARHSRVALAALSLLLVAYAASQVAPLRARATFAAAITHLSDGEPALFRATMEKVHGITPDDAFYLNLHACLLAEVGSYPLWFPRVDFGPNRIDEANALLTRSLAIDPEQELPHNHLAWHLLASDPARAAEHFCAAARLIPDKGSLYFGLALSLFAQQRPEPATRALAMELVNDPSFAASPEWAAFRDRPDIISAARRQAAQELEHLAAVAETNDPLRYARRARYAAALLRWLDNDDTSLEQALEHAEPAQADLLRWLAGRPDPTPVTSPAAWLPLARAAADPTQARAPLAEHYARTPLDDAAMDDLLQAIRIPDRRDLIRMDRAPAELLRHSPRIYRERIAYPLLHRNLDAPAPRDPYLPPLNRIARDFLWPLFPEKGFLPGPVLIQAQRDLGLAEAAP